VRGPWSAGLALAFALQGGEHLLGRDRQVVDDFGEGQAVDDGVEKLLAEPDLTVEGLEQRLIEMLGADQKDRVMKVSELASFKTIVLGPLSQARIKLASGGAPRVISCKGKGAMKQFKAFYA